ncbi:guanylate-binding protein 2-like [Ruditapes philippinarum]|uniref:guanylate-binding protein 2-like n=1 Tax=Ruditapes philippinarum TaxID=129788 RepID=UPI00295BF560|nr:guanylate-binding protein 2-like [Ruditapes philippinarum]
MTTKEHKRDYFGSEMAEDDIQIESRMENMSIGNLTSNSKLFDKPQPLIYTDKAGPLQLNGDVLTQLSHINKKLNVVCVCGSYRTGKSYLMNWIAGDKTGFNLGDTVRSETKGIWIWCREHPKQSDQVLVLLDTEGFGDPEKRDPEHDNKMFCLALLMSSTLIINVKSVIEYSTLKELEYPFSIHLAIHSEGVSFGGEPDDSYNVQLQSEDDDKAEEKHNAKTIQIASPTLIMCIRDFYLEMMMDGRLQTANEYLEANLKSVELSTLSEKQQKKQKKSNNINECIKAYFPKRTCFTIAQPAMGGNLKNIEQLDETSLDKTFVEDIKALQNYVYDRKPKYICNASKKPLEGPVYDATV